MRVAGTCVTKIVRRQSPLFAFWGSTNKSACVSNACTLFSRIQPERTESSDLPPEVPATFYSRVAGSLDSDMCSTLEPSLTFWGSQRSSTVAFLAPTGGPLIVTGRPIWADLPLPGHLFGSGGSGYPWQVGSRNLGYRKLISGGALSSRSGGLHINPHASENAYTILFWFQPKRNF